jgi:hypothetical protein
VIYRLYGLVNGQVLVNAERGWFRYEPDAGRIFPVNGLASDIIADPIDLPDGRVVVA